MKKPVFTLRIGTGSAPVQIPNNKGKLVPVNNKIAVGILSEFRRHLPKEKK